jgi:hypothetical protein
VTYNQPDVTTLLRRTSTKASQIHIYEHTRNGLPQNFITANIMVYNDSL